jgi:hypothetical protein
MCAEDVSLEIWTHLDRSSRASGREGPDRLVLEACSARLSEILIDCLPYNEYGEDLAEAVGNFSQVVASTMILDGRLAFEISLGWNQGQIEAARLAYIPQGSLCRIGPWYFQVVPPDARRDRAHGRIVRLPAERVIVFRPPAHLCRAVTIHPHSGWH